MALAAGRAADSVGLLGFGLDSLAEVSGGLIVLWQFRHPLPESRERAAQKAMAVAFFALAAFVGFEAIRTLWLREPPSESIVGMVLAAVSLCVMPLLALAKRSTGRELGSRTVVADSIQTLLCTYLSGVLLLGLALNALLGWWWADPVAALVIAFVAAREGWEYWEGEECDDDTPGGSGEDECESSDEGTSGPHA